MIYDLKDSNIRVSTKLYDIMERMRERRGEREEYGGGGGGGG